MVTLNNFEGQLLFFSFLLLGLLALEIVAAVAAIARIWHKAHLHKSVVAKAVKHNTKRKAPSADVVKPPTFHPMLWLRRHKWLALAGAFVVLHTGAVVFSASRVVAMVKPLPEVASTSPAQNGIWTNDFEPIEIRFNVPVDTRKLSLHLSPEIPGRWELAPYAPWLPYTRQARFYPEVSPEPATHVMVYVSFMANAVNPGAGQEFLLEFDTQPLPEVTSSSLSDEAVDVPVGADIFFRLDGELSLSSKWQVMVDPPIESELIACGPDCLKAVFARPLSQGTAYHMALMRTVRTYEMDTLEEVSRGESQTVRELDFVTVRPPLINSFSPQGTGILSGEKMVLVFDESMVRESVEPRLTVVPELTYSREWSEDSKTLTLVPEVLQKETEYRVTLEAGAQNVKGGLTEQEIIYTFTTIGPIQVTAVSLDGARGVGTKTALSFTFDQAVDHASAQAHLILNPAANGSFSWQDNTMTFVPQGWVAETTYQYTLSAGIESIEGLPLREGVTGRFTTAPRRVALDVPMYRQGSTGDDAWSCNFVAARMLLAYRGVQVSTETLRTTLPYQGGRGSGNPHLGFVPGYGTYWEAVSDVVSRYRSVRFLPAGNLQALLTEVQNGNPVMIWGQNGWSTPTNISWTADDGTTINAVSGMHSVVVRGYEGTPDAPAAILLNDPWRGQTSVSVSQFKKNWGYYNVAMVVE